MLHLICSESLIIFMKKLERAVVMGFLELLEKELNF